MTSALPKELRERVVQAYENGEGSQGKLAVRFKDQPSKVVQENKAI